MPAFVRKTLVTMSARFSPPNYVPPGGWQDYTPPTQPSTVIANIRYPVTRKPWAFATAQVAFTLQADGVTWLGTWDSSASIEGTCLWVIFASGNGVQSAAEGSFEVLANSANNF